MLGFGQLRRQGRSEGAPPSPFSHLACLRFRSQLSPSANITNVDTKVVTKQVAKLSYLAIFPPQSFRRVAFFKSLYLRYLLILLRGQLLANYPRTKIKHDL